MFLKDFRRRDQARNDKLCPYSNKGFGGRRLCDPCRAVDAEKNEKRKRVRVVCPVCRRRMWGWAVYDHDACFVFTAVPPHKRKAWWRKKKTKWRKKKTKPIKETGIRRGRKGRVYCEKIKVRCLREDQAYHEKDAKRRFRQRQERITW